MTQTKMDSPIAGTIQRNKYFMSVSHASIPRSMDRMTSPNFFFKCQSSDKPCKCRKAVSDNCTKAACATLRYTSDWHSLRVKAKNCIRAYRAANLAHLPYSVNASAVEARPRNTGAESKHAFAEMTNTQVIMARIRFTVAEDAVAFGQKYGLRIMSMLRVVKWAFFSVVVVGDSLLLLLIYVKSGNTFNSMITKSMFVAIKDRVTKSILEGDI
mmetsp:Transcript_15606/g.22223  ORF Transcript_15606/g.22223 Transcript_15606/m.22223 type:complete len:213 (-) Transcript_15606:136-774(-)